jgi:FtsH-binding integral membrane protein
MNPLFKQQSMQAERQSAAVDAGLRAYMLRIYNLMASALIVTGLVAWFSAEAAVSGGQLTGFGQALYASPLKWVVMLAPLGVVFYLSARMYKMSTTAAQGWFWGFAALMGLSLSSIFLVYTGTSIARTFFVTAAAFGALSLYGYTTKKDLSGWGSFLFMGVIGLIIASLVNLFLQSTALQFAVSALGVLIFAGLTAYDTQRLKTMYYQIGGHAETLARASIMGALSLYLDFINMFMFLLQFMGGRE